MLDQSNFNLYNGIFVSNDTDNRAVPDFDN